MIGRPPRPTLFPCPTLFRSVVLGLPAHGTHAVIDWVLALRAELQIPPTLAGIVDEGFADEAARAGVADPTAPTKDRKSTRLNSSHANISYAVFCLKKKKNTL